MQSITLLDKGGLALWIIAGLSVLTLAVILWKIWRLAQIGAWSRKHSDEAVELFLSGEHLRALGLLDGRKTIRAKTIRAAIRSRHDGLLDDASAREETTRVAKVNLAEARTGLRALELISTVAPLLGLLGTVLGMITAFQALQTAGTQADPKVLAGGIWEALLTTAAGMAVSIPASAALTWFESVVDSIRIDLENSVTKIFVKPVNIPLAAAAE